MPHQYANKGKVPIPLFQKPGKLLYTALVLVRKIYVLSNFYQIYFFKNMYLFLNKIYYKKFCKSNSIFR